MLSSHVICSVIIPAYNASQTLEQTLSALVDQNMPAGSFEVIVVDDGSTDNTSAITSNYGVTCIRQPNAGPASARNAGARAAQGDILLFTDADCIPASDWVTQMLTPFARQEISGVQGAYRTRQTELAARFAQAEFEDRYALMQRYESIDLVATYAAGFRRKLFLEMDGFDERFPVANNEDTEFSYRLVQNGAILVFAPHAIVYHRHPPALRRYLRTKFWRAYWRIVVYRKYPLKAVHDRYTTVLVKAQTLSMLASAVFTLGALLSLTSWLLPSVIWTGIAISSLPLARTIAHTDPQLALVTPGIVFLRTCVLALGSIWGILRCLRS